MKKINENTLAKTIASQEGKKTEINIAQVKEVTKLVLDYLAEEWELGNELAVIELITKHKKNIPF